jgi:hypothetical protein
MTFRDVIIHLTLSRTGNAGLVAELLFELKKLGIRPSLMLDIADDEPPPARVVADNAVARFCETMEVDLTPEELYDLNVEDKTVQEFIDETLVLTDEAEYKALPKLSKASKRMAKKAVRDEYRFWARNGSASRTTAKEFHEMFVKKCATKKIQGNHFYLCSRQPGAEDEGGEDEGEDEGGRLLTGGK